MFLISERTTVALWPLWTRLSLVKQFTVIGLTVLLLGMVAIGTWVGHKIEQGVTQNTALAMALYLDNFIAPIVQELTDNRNISADTAVALDKIFANNQLALRIPSIKIWTSDGRIVFATLDKKSVGMKFEPSSELKAAWSGAISSKLDQLQGDESANERATGISLLEVYSPIRNSHSGKTIAVAEFYASAEQLKADLLEARVQSWGVVGIVALTMIGLLFGIVQSGSRTIDSQRFALQTQVRELSDLLRQNMRLRRRVEDSSERAAESNERFLRRISAELHDGPAQHLALSMLRLDSLKPHIRKTRKKSGDPLAELEIIRRSVADAMKEIRFLSSGLALPEIESKNLKETISFAIRSHQKRTDMNVVSDIGKLPESVKMSIKVCIYRFVQEALNNAFFHANGVGASVKASLNDGELVIQVTDDGPGIQAADSDAKATGLGLPGIKERVECLSGKFSIDTSPGNGTRVKARFSADILGVSHDQ